MLARVSTRHRMSSRRSGIGTTMSEKRGGLRILRKGTMADLRMQVVENRPQGRVTCAPGRIAKWEKPKMVQNIAWEKTPLSFKIRPSVVAHRRSNGT